LYNKKCLDGGNHPGGGILSDKDIVADNIDVGKRLILAYMLQNRPRIVPPLEQFERTVFFMENRIPDDVLSDYVREYVNSTRRESYARHPERVMRQRLTSAANLLNRHGLIDDRQRASILEAVKGANV
jgi:hypothetical protein